MKGLKFLSYFLFAALFFSCSKEEIKTSTEETTLATELESRAQAPWLSLYDVEQLCHPTLGPYTKLHFEWDANSNLYGTIYVDLTHATTGVLAGTWSRQYTNTNDDIIMYVGFEQGAAKDCSLLLPKTKYNVHVYKLNGSTEYQMMPDFMIKTDFCICTG